VGKKTASINRKLENFNSLKNEFEYLVEVADMLKLEDDKDLQAEISSNLPSLQKKCEKLYLTTLLSGEYDNNNAILTLNSGAGGTESNDWTQMLYRMYVRYAESGGFKVSLLNRLKGDVAGIKSVSFLISGENAYGYLKSEKGVHRLVRISPFDSNSRRHTSFTALDVMPEIEDDDIIEIKSEEIRIDTYRASGAGGQHVNTTDSAVRITHFESGVVVTCQNERSQIQNRETAMKMLKSKLVQLKEQQHKDKLAGLKGKNTKVEWGSQIRSYVMHPYSMVKDHRTSFETSNVNTVMDGELQGFIDEYLKSLGKENV
jgi:peptide chain release factor 2